MIYLTGDTHGNFKRIKRFCEENHTNVDDILIVLGDNGVNFTGGARDKWLKTSLANYPITFFLIRGNHDRRPSSLKTISKVSKFGNECYTEEYSNIYYGIDGKQYLFDEKKCLVIGGAYSVDKFYRLEYCPDAWFANEQLSEVEMKKIIDDVSGKKYDFVLTHTAPEQMIPYESLPMRLTGIDKSMEYFFDKLHGNITYKKWYCGHFHIEKVVGNMEFMFENIKRLGE